MSSVDSAVMMFIFRLKVPEVHRHVSSIGLPWAVITTKWFICLFAEVLPIEVRECWQGPHLVIWLKQTQNKMTWHMCFRFLCFL